MERSRIEAALRRREKARKALEAADRELIEEARQVYDSRASELARALSVSRATFSRLLERD